MFGINCLGDLSEDANYGRFFGTGAMSSMQASRGKTRLMALLLRNRETPRVATPPEAVWHENFLQSLRQFAGGGAEDSARKELAELTLNYSKERYDEVLERYFKLDQRIEDLGKFVVGFYGAAVAIVKLLSPAAVGKVADELPGQVPHGDEWTVLTLLVGAALGCLTVLVVLWSKRTVNLPTTTDAQKFADYALKQGLDPKCRDATVVQFFLASSYAYVAAAMLPAIQRKASYLNKAAVFGILTVLTSVGVLLLGLWPEVPDLLRLWVSRLGHIFSWVLGLGN
jgi:hypothetical protein